MMKLLIVEDDIDSRVYLERSLKAQGYSVDTAGNGVEAMGRINQSIPDIIISDILMPEMDGFELCRRIKKDENLRTIPFVFYTATYVDQQDEDLAMSLGASRFVVKPMEMNVFLNLIEEVLEEHKKKKLPVQDHLKSGDEEIERKHADALIKKLSKKVRELEQERIEVQKKEEEWRHTFDSISDHVAVIDLNFRIAKANNSLASLAGKDPDELVGKHCYEVVHGLKEPVFDCPHREMLKTKKAVTREQYSPSIDKYFLVTSSPIFEGDELKGSIHFMKDITESKKMEISFRKLSRAVEQSPLSIIITDTEGKMEYVNPYFTELTGYSLKEALAVHPSILKSGIHPPELYDELWKTITSGNVWRGQFHNRKKNGEMYWEDATISPITDEKGDIKNYIAIKEDITKRKSLEEQLLQSQKMEGIGRLAGGVAHDFNNILSAIISYAYLAGMDAGDDLKLKHNVDQITVLASRASEITKGLLEFSRKHPYNPAPLNINEKIMSVKKIMNKFLGEDIELNIKLADRYLVIMADTVQIEQIIMNLATNAYDAMNGSGTLSILTEMMTIDNSFIQLNKFGKPGTYAVITVSDTGTGMNKNIKQMIFEPFFTTKEVGKGTGLGLSIVYGIVKQHQGFIHVYSEPGHGTTFKLYFKIADTDAIEQIKEEPIAADLSGHEETILLAEDEEDVRAVETTILQKYNYRVIEAVDGQDAIDKFINNMDMIKLCILDAVMPKKNGKEVIEAIRKNKSNTNIILTSGYAADVISCTGIPKEGLEFLPKPILPDNLLKTVKKVLNN
jgi:two-component system NtrC family sensor kinase